MTLIVETGGAASNSESYAAVSDADLYWSNRSNTVWAALATPDKESNLRKATQYMTAVYRQKWKGRRVSTTQALDWPRVGVVLDDFNSSQNTFGFGYYGIIQVPYTSIPTEVMNACCELALRASAGDLAADLDRETLSEGVGSVNVTYRAGAVQHIRYRFVDLMLTPLFLAGGSMIVRA